MFKLMKLNTDRFRVYNDAAGIDSQGDTTEAFEMMRSLGVPEAETQRAVTEMIRTDANCADFGFNMQTGVPAFIFTERRYVGLEGHKLAYIQTEEEQAAEEYKNNA
jgi:hypothetical protein